MSNTQLGTQPSWPRATTRNRGFRRRAASEERDESLSAEQLRAWDDYKKGFNAAPTPSDTTVFNYITLELCQGGWASDEWVVREDGIIVTRCDFLKIRTARQEYHRTGSVKEITNRYGAAVDFEGIHLIRSLNGVHYRILKSIPDPHAKPGFFIDPSGHEINLRTMRLTNPNPRANYDFDNSAATSKDYMFKEDDEYCYYTYSNKTKLLNGVEGMLLYVGALNKHHYESPNYVRITKKDRSNCFLRMYYEDQFYTVEEVTLEEIQKLSKKEFFEQYMNLNDSKYLSFEALKIIIQMTERFYTETVYRLWFKTEEAAQKITQLRRKKKEDIVRVIDGTIRLITNEPNNANQASNDVDSTSDESNDADESNNANQASNDTDSTSDDTNESDDADESNDADSAVQKVSLEEELIMFLQTYSEHIASVNGIITGSAAAYLVNQQIAPPNDIDIWVQQLVNKENYTQVVHAFEESGWIVTYCDIPFSRNISPRIRTIATLKHKRFSLNAQIVFVTNDPRTIIDEFDLSVSKAIWDPRESNNLRHTEQAVINDIIAQQAEFLERPWDLQKHYNTNVEQQLSLTTRALSRLLKYLRKGFTIRMSPQSIFKVEDIAAQINMFNDQFKAQCDATFDGYYVYNVDEEYRDFIESFIKIYEAVMDDDVEYVTSVFLNKTVFFLMNSIKPEHFTCHRLTLFDIKTRQPVQLTNFTSALFNAKVDSVRVRAPQMKYE